MGTTKHESLGWEPVSTHPVAVDLSATFHSFRARLYHKCMRSALALLTALVSLISPARAQSPLLDWGLLNLGLAFPTGMSSHIVLAIGGTCATTHTGWCADVEIGFEGRSGFINLANIGYSVAFGPERSTSLFPRVGITAVEISKYGSFFVGYDAGVGLRHEFKSPWAGSVDYTWRHYPGFVWPMVTLGIVASP